MKKDEILLKLTEYLIEYFEIPESKITLKANLYNELTWIVWMAVDLIVKLQELTQKKFSPADFKEVRTIGDVVDKVYETLNQ